MLEQSLKNILTLSKASDGEYSVGSTSYWRKYLATNSKYIYGGSAPAGITTTSVLEQMQLIQLDADNGWDQNAENVLVQDLVLQVCSLVHLLVVKTTVEKQITQQLVH